MKNYNLYKVKSERTNAIGSYFEEAYVVAKSISQVGCEGNVISIEVIQKDIKIIKQDDL